MTPRTVTVQVDTREQRPLLFPRLIGWVQPNARGRDIIKVKTEIIKLDAGDYRLKHSKTTCIIERKASLRELQKNFTGKDRPRQLAALDKLADAAQHFVVLVETTPRGLVAPNKDCDHPEYALCPFLRQITNRGGSLIISGTTSPTPSNRRYAGELALRILLAYADTPQ